MKKFAVNFSILSLFVLISVGSGCAVMGRRQINQPLSAINVSKLKAGMTKAQVTELLGAPQDILFIRKDNDPVRELAYVYNHTTTKYTGVVFAFLNFGNSDENQDRVVVFLNADGIVEHIGATLEGQKTDYGFPFGS